MELHEKNVHSVDSLLKRINLLSENITRFIENNSRYENISKPPLNLNWWQHILTFFLLTMVSYYFILVIFEFILPTVAANVSYAQTNTWFKVYSFILFIAYFFTYNKLFQSKLKRKLKNNETQINNIVDENTRILSFLEQETVIPKTYHNLHALNRFDMYFRDGRADTLKEAMNLYEQEVRSEEQLREIKYMQQLQEISYKKADEAATLGWINLFLRK